MVEKINACKMVSCKNISIKSHFLSISKKKMVPQIDHLKSILPINGPLMEGAKWFTHFCSEVKWKINGFEMVNGI